MVYAITFAFIVLDFVTGLIKAVSSGKFKSSMMREGLFHKIHLQKVSLACGALAALFLADCVLSFLFRTPITY